MYHTDQPPLQLRHQPSHVYGPSAGGTCYTNVRGPAGNRSKRKEKWVVGFWEEDGGGGELRKDGGGDPPHLTDVTGRVRSRFSCPGRLPAAPAIGNYKPKRHQPACQERVLCVRGLCPVAPSWFETRSQIGSKNDTQKCCTIRVQYWTGDRDDVLFEPPKLTIRNLDPRSAAINHEISLLQHFYIRTKNKLDPLSELGSFDLGLSGKILVQPGIRSARELRSTKARTSHALSYAQGNTGLPSAIPLREFTVRNVLYEAGFHGRTARRKPYLNYNRRKRIAYAKTNRNKELDCNCKTGGGFGTNLECKSANGVGDWHSMNVKAVHDKVSTFEIKRRKKSLFLPAYILTGAMSDVCSVKQGPDCELHFYTHDDDHKHTTPNARTWLLCNTSVTGHQSDRALVGCTGIEHKKTHIQQVDFKSAHRVQPLPKYCSDIYSAPFIVEIFLQMPRCPEGPGSQNIPAYSLKRKDPAAPEETSHANRRFSLDATAFLRLHGRVGHTRPPGPIPLAVFYQAQREYQLRGSPALTKQSSLPLSTTLCAARQAFHLRQSGRQRPRAGTVITICSRCECTSGTSARSVLVNLRAKLHSRIHHVQYFTVHLAHIVPRELGCKQKHASPVVHTEVLAAEGGLRGPAAVTGLYVLSQKRLIAFESLPDKISTQQITLANEFRGYSTANVFEMDDTLATREIF
ncbi:hypothetical protein PR048_008091 [Dryococelus australis]|uniref:Uncharacterized protein n=1 Tax=Dryococelus australis TaxID=614101 RepID=A0ABQ9HW42_9NEOP|nr:hypothetical protein PR048_008091 [Dryococelus australis]